MITNHVTSLPVSKRLAPHLPVGWESIMRWQRSRRNKYNKWGAWKADMPMFYDVQDELYQFYPAPLLSEIMELLPKRVNKQWLDIDYAFALIGYKETWFVSFDMRKIEDAAAELFMWVKENGHIKEGA